MSHFFSRYYIENTKITPSTRLDILLRNRRNTYCDYLIAVYHKIQVKFDYGVFHIYRSWVMALFLLENRDFLGFLMIFKVWLNQIFSNFNTMMNGKCQFHHNQT
jgi:hypothetical protein